VVEVRQNQFALSFNSIVSCVTYFNNVKSFPPKLNRVLGGRPPGNGILSDMTNVPLLDLKAQFAQIRAEVMPAIDQVCASQHFILGEHVRALEEEVARYCAASAGIGVSSGTDALLLALMALNIGAGDEVITSPFTFFATAGTIARTGARPVFCDIDPVTFNLSPAAVQTFIDDHCAVQGEQLINRATGGRIKALMPVHLYGQSADMDPLMAIARRHRLKVIEDAAQAIGTQYKNGVRAGTIGDVGCFSFFPSKNLGAFGDAGLCTINDAELAETMRVLRVHGGKPKYFHALIGGNFRIDELQAAVLRVKLKYLDGWTEGRQRNAAYYDAAFASAGLGANLRTPLAIAGYRHIFNQYVVRAHNRDALRARLTERGIGSEIYYPVPLHLQKCFEYLNYRAGDFPQSERAAGETLALPIYPELTQVQLAHVVATIAEFYV
jgi:dTDP-4-amino-4,6-dideoxygalactose transaminase